MNVYLPVLTCLVLWHRGGGSDGFQGYKLELKANNLTHHKCLLKCLMFAFHGSSSYLAVNTKSSGEFSVDFTLADVSDAESPAGECSTGSGPSQSRSVVTRLARRLRRKQDREGLLRIHGAPPPDSSEED